MKKSMRAFVFLILAAVPAARPAGAEDAVSANEVPPFILIDDFEAGSDMNVLKGKTGAWVLDPGDTKTYCAAQVVALKGTSRDSKKSLRLRYSVDSDAPAQCGYWSILNSINASKYDHLEFEVRGDEAEGFTSEFRVEIKRFKEKGSGAKLTGMKTVKNVSSKWQTIRIPLTSFTGLYDASRRDPENVLENVDEFIIILHKRGVTSRKGALYLDNVRFVRTGVTGPSHFDRPPLPEKDKAYLILENREFEKEYLAPSDKAGRTFTRTAVQADSADGIVEYLKQHPGYRLAMRRGKEEYVAALSEKGTFGFVDHDTYVKFLVNRLKGFPKKTIVKKKFPANDEKFLREIARDTWAFFDNIVDKEHGLPLDTVALGKETPLGEGCVLGDYTNVTNIGVYLCSVVAAYDLGFITKDDAVERLKLTLGTIRELETSRSGFHYNYYDTTWCKKTEYFVSLVDSGWLTAGMYVVGNAFPEEVGSLCKELLSRENYAFFYDPVEQQMWHGYYDNLGEYVNYHYGMLFAEPRLASFLAIGKGDVEAEHWFRMVRTYPREYSWTTQPPKNRTEKEYQGIKYWGGWYEYKEYKYVPSWGGSMFEALMPTLLIDEKKEAPQGMGLNGEMHVKAAIDYTLNELRYPVWGMSPSSTPDGKYSEYGVRVLGVAGYAAGTVTPHASFLALEYTPREALKNIRKILAGWDIYGEYGFYDALDPLSRKVAYKYLSLDQGMILMAIDNYLNDGALKKRFGGDPQFEKAKQLLRDERFYE